MTLCDSHSASFKKASACSAEFAQQSHQQLLTSTAFASLLSSSRLISSGMELAQAVQIDGQCHVWFSNSNGICSACAELSACCWLQGRNWKEVGRYCAMQPPCQLSQAGAFVLTRSEQVSTGTHSRHASEQLLAAFTNINDSRVAPAAARQRLAE